MSVLDKILDMVAKSGPVLPVEIAARLKIDSFLASGYISQLVDAGKLKASKEKVNGTSVYFTPGQEYVAEQKVKDIINSAQKTARAFAKSTTEDPETQKKREAFADRLREIEEREKKEGLARQKVIPVTLRKLKEDFTAAPGKQAVGGEHKIKEEQKIPSEAESGLHIAGRPLELQHIRPQVTREPWQTEQDAEKAISKVAQSPRKVGRKTEAKPVEEGPVVQSALAFLVEAGADILDKELKGKGRDAILTVLLPTKIGNLQMLVMVKDKKKISEADLSMAYTEGMKRKTPILFITNGNLTGTSREYYENIAGFLKFKSLSGV